MRMDVHYNYIKNDENISLPDIIIPTSSEVEIILTPEEKRECTELSMTPEEYADMVINRRINTAQNKPAKPNKKTIVYTEHPNCYDKNRELECSKNNCIHDICPYTGWVLPTG